MDLSIDPTSHPLVGPFEWNGMTLAEDGAFAQTKAANDRAEGRLYGPQFEEAGGVFVHGDFVGAFGLARKTP